MKQYTRY